jgi:hypothetical protein
MKLAQETIQSADRTVDKMGRRGSLAKPCTFIQTVAMFYASLYRFKCVSRENGDNSRLNEKSKKGYGLFPTEIRPQVPFWSLNFGW